MLDCGAYSCLGLIFEVSRKRVFPSRLQQSSRVTFSWYVNSDFPLYFQSMLSYTNFLKKVSLFPYTNIYSSLLYHSSHLFSSLLLWYIASSCSPQHILLKTSFLPFYSSHPSLYPNLSVPALLYVSKEGSSSGPLGWWWWNAFEGPAAFSLQPACKIFPMGNHWLLFTSPRGVQAPW